MGDIVVKERTPEEVLQNFLTMLKRVFDRSFFAAAHISAMFIPGL